MPTIQEFIEEHGLTVAAVRVPSNPYMDMGDKWEGIHFRVVISKGKRKLETYFSVGVGIAYMWGKENPDKVQRRGLAGGEFDYRKDVVKALSIYGGRVSLFQEGIRKMAIARYPGPELADVLNCLASDASTYANSRSFEEWAGDLGYDTDSRKAERTYEAIRRQYLEMETLLGRDALKTLMFEVERM